MEKLINRKFIFIITSALILIPVILFVFLGRAAENVPPSSIITPTISGRNPLTPVPTESKDFMVLGTTLPKRDIGLSEGFIINFSQTPSPSEFFYEVNPPSTLNLSLRGTSILVMPQPAWSPGTEYEFIIKKVTKDTYGNPLNKDSIFKFKTLPQRGM